MSDQQQQQPLEGAQDRKDGTSPLNNSESKTPKLGRVRTESKVSLDGSYKYSFTASEAALATLSALDYGVESVQGHRKTMEDQHKATCGDNPVTPRGDGSESKARSGIPFFGVYDGHGGTGCADFLRARLHVLMLSHEKITSDPATACHEAILQAEEEFMKKCREERLESGSTVAVTMIIDNKLIVANVGDSEVVLARDGVAECLTTKHHLSANESEAERIKSVGGRIFHNRVGHPKFNPSLVSLAVTRAVGDAGFKLEEYTDGKPSGVIADPAVNIVELGPKDNFFIIGCDGLWDVIKYQEAVDFCKNLMAAGASSTEVSQSIVQEALNKGSSDNVTVLVVALQKPTLFMDSVTAKKDEKKDDSLASTEPASSQ